MEASLALGGRGRVVGTLGCPDDACGALDGAEAVHVDVLLGPAGQLLCRALQQLGDLLAPRPVWGGGGGGGLQPKKLRTRNGAEKFPLW